MFHIIFKKICDFWNFKKFKGASFEKIILGPEYNRNFNDSVKYYEKVTKLNSGDKDVWLRLGMCYLYTDLLDKAIAAFELANKLLPMNTDVYTGWGMVFMRQKKYYPIALSKSTNQPLPTKNKSKDLKHGFQVQLILNLKAEKPNMYQDDAFLN